MIDYGSHHHHEEDGDATMRDHDTNSEADGTGDIVSTGENPLLDRADVPVDAEGHAPAPGRPSPDAVQLDLAPWRPSPIAVQLDLTRAHRADTPDCIVLTVEGVTKTLTIAQAHEISVVLGQASDAGAPIRLALGFDE